MPSRHPFPARARAIVLLLATAAAARARAIVLLFVAATAALLLAGCSSQTADQFVSPLPAEPASIVAGDFDGDGREDVLVGYSAADYVGITAATQDEYGFFTRRELSTVVVGSELLATTDLDGDGALDVVAAQRGLDRFTLLRNRGDGTFTSSVKEVASVSPPGSTRITALTSATTPSNKRLVAVAFETDDPDAAVRPRSVVVYEARGGGLSAANVFQTFDVVPGDARVLRLFDVDGDGRLDLLVGTAAGTVQIYRGVAGAEGSLATTPTTLFHPQHAEPVTALAAGDVQSPASSIRAPSLGSWPTDGKADVVASLGGEEVYGWRGRGGMSFDPPVVTGITAAVNQKTVELAVDPSGSGDWVGIGGGVSSGFAESDDGWQPIVTKSFCGTTSASVFPNDAEFARFAVALTCFTNGADKALIVFPERRRLSVPAAVALGSQRSGTSGPATTVELTAVDRSLDNNPTEVDVEGVVSIGRISLSGPDAGDFEIVRALGGRCGDRSEASALRCLPQVRFAPRTPGAKQATLVIESDGYRAPGAPPHSVALTGTATGALASAPASLALGDVAVGGSSRATLTVTNTGNEALAIDELTLENAGAGWSVASGTCAATVAPGASCAAQVTYAPAATGAASASVRVVSDSVGAAPVVALSARGVASGVTAAPLALGPVAVGDSASATAQIVNTGNVALQISSVAAAGPDAARVSVDAVGCAGASVAPGAGCDIEVTVAPQARGALDAELRVLSNAPSSPNVVALSATGVQGVAEGPEAVALGSVRVGSFAEAEVELSNDGDAPLTLGSLAVEGAAELVADACSEATMAVGEECAATVRFTPTAPGALDARLRVPNDGEGGERIVELTGTGLPEEEPGGEAPGGREPGGGDAGGREPGGGDPGGGDPGGGDPGGREPGGGNPGGGDGGGGDLGGGGPGGGGPGGGGAGGDGALRGGGDAGRGGERPPGGSAGDAGKARLKLIAPARATVRRGRTVRLRIGVRNAGQRAAAATGLSLRLPASLRWLPPRRAGRGASMAARTVDLRVGRLAAGSARAFTVTVRAQPRARRGVVALVLRAEGAGGATATTALRIR